MLIVPLEPPSTDGGGATTKMPAGTPLLHSSDSGNVPWLLTAMSASTEPVSPIALNTPTAEPGRGFDTSTARLVQVSGHGVSGPPGVSVQLRLPPAVLVELQPRRIFAVVEPVATGLSTTLTA